MNTFTAAVATPVATTTTNGMAALDKTGSKMLDLFYTIGSSRNNPEIVQTFMAAFGHNPSLAMKCLFWARDIRGGAGERKVFRDIMLALENVDLAAVLKTIPLIAEYGRWDDLLVFTNKQAKNIAYATIARALLTDHNGLCAKWMPRKGSIASELRLFLRLSPKAYRKLLVNLSKTVETNMCAQEWDKIEYSHVPSVAASRYQAAFKRHDTGAYTAYKEGLASGATKVNASAVFPHDVVRSIKGGGDVTVINAQWDALPDYVGSRKVLPVSDVSGSMSCPASGSISCMDISIALGLYLASKNSGPFKDIICTFSENPSLLHVEGDFVTKYSQLKMADWGMSTNLEKTFAHILDVAKNNFVPPEEMPEAICIMSDMQFNAATRSSETALDMIKRKYSEAGYTMPSIIFWNLNASYGNMPSASTENGVALISGFSPAIMKAVLAGDLTNITPEAIMLDVLLSERYAAVAI